MPELDGAGFATKCVHGFGGPDAHTGAVVPPISLATTFAQDGVGGLREGGFEYSRSGNPTRAALEQHLAVLEGGAHGFAFASGLAAEDTLFRLLNPGDHVLLPDDAYGGTIRLGARVVTRSGVEVDTVDLTDLDAVTSAWRPETRMLWVETPTNPLLRIVDIAAVAALAHARRPDAIVVVDNTFATPALQQPLALGADVVVHSSTKYLGGHSDVVGGAVVVHDHALAERIGFLQNAAGAVPSPFDCYLVIRGLRTLDLRMHRHSSSAGAIAAFLDGYKGITEVRYPGLPHHPGHSVAVAQMNSFGGMVSFRVAGGESSAVEVCRRTKLFTLAESLGAVESLIEHPGRMTHASVAGTPNEVPGDLVRLSIGIEDPQDLIDDLQRALG